MISTKRLHSIHKWTGLIAGINILLLSMTGAYLVFHEDIQEAFGITLGPEVTTVDPASDHPIQDAVDAVVALNPGSEPIRVREVELVEDAREIVLVHDGGYKLYTMDLPTGAVREYEAGLVVTINDFIFQLHANLMLGIMGTAALGLVAILFLTSTVTGLFIYGPFMKQALFGLFRKKNGLRKASADLHKLVGISSLGFNLLMAVTGIALTLGMLGVQYWSLKEIQSRTAHAIDETTAQRPPIDIVWTAAASVHDEARVVNIAYPGGYQGKNYYLVYHESPGAIRRYIPTLSLVPVADTAAAEVLAIPLWIEIVMICFPLHFGNFAGLGLKVVYSLFGIGAGVLTITGSVMTFTAWGRKWRPRKRMPAMEGNLVGETVRVKS